MTSTIQQFTFVLIGLILTGTATDVHAETSLLLEPGTGTYPIGETFEVEVRLDTDGEDISAAEGAVSYNQNDLTVVTVSTEDSIFTSWLVTPTVDEDAGRISFQGLMSAGRSYRGTDGLLMTITFRAERQNTSRVWFSQGAAVVASDAVGTNVLEALRTATYTLAPREVTPLFQNALAAQAIAANVSSGDIEITPIPVPKDEWFGTTTVKLSWSLPGSVTRLRADVHESPGARPTTDYVVPVSTITLDELEEGTQYFHLQFLEDDTWGEVTQFPLRIDLTPPEYVLAQEAERRDVADPRLRFAIDAADTLSGIRHFEIEIDGDEPVVWEGDTDYFEPGTLEPGEHTLYVTAFDRAGNTVATSVDFRVQALESPVVVSAPDEVIAGSPIVVRGSTYPDSTVTVFHSLDEGEPQSRTVESDSTGMFVANITDAAQSGMYTVWFQVHDDRGAASELSLKRSIESRQPLVVLMGGIAVSYLSIFIPLIGMVLLLGLILWYSFVWLRTYRSRVRRETTDASEVVVEEFARLRDTLREQVGELQQAKLERQLTRQEMRILDELKARLDHIEERILWEIDDIEPDRKNRTVMNEHHVSDRRNSASNTTSGAASADPAGTIRLARRE